MRATRRHNPEFTMLEAYQAYTDYRGMMELTVPVQQVAEGLGKLQMEKEGDPMILMEAKYKDLIQAVGRDDGLSYPGTQAPENQGSGHRGGSELEDFEVTNSVFEKVIEHTLIRQTFVTHIPRELCPLAKVTEDDESTIGVFELCINGKEIAPAYSEQNDPFVQREAFMRQVGEETRNWTTIFCSLSSTDASAGGMGLGIDRLVIFRPGLPIFRFILFLPFALPRKGPETEEGAVGS